jgi:hypothetical protein
VAVTTSDVGTSTDSSKYSADNDSGTDRFWNLSFTEYFALFHVTLTADIGGPMLLFDKGGSTNGLAIHYRTGPDTISASIASGGTHYEAQSTGTFGIGDEIIVAVKYIDSEIKIFINGVLEDTLAGPSSVPDHGNPTGFFGVSRDEASNSTAPDGWEGLGYMAALGFKAPSDAECIELTKNPYKLLKPANDFYYFTAAAGGATAAVTGTATASITESDIVTGGKTIIITLTGDTFKAAGTGPIGSTADTQALINNIDSAQAEGTGWDAVVKAGLSTTDVTRTSSTVATITLPAFGSYDITAQETITVTVPTDVLVTAAGAITASPTFTVDTVAAGAGTVKNLLLLGVG